MFDVDVRRCHDLGAVIAHLSMRPDAFLRTGPEMGTDLVRGLVFFYVSGICHQTESLHGIIAGEKKRGWDYLMGKFVELAKTSSDAVMPWRMREISSESLQSLLSDSSNPAESTLSRVDERVHFLQDMAQGIIAMHCGDARAIYGDGSLGGSDGAYAQMGKFAAFGADPIMKKATIFFMLMRKSELWEKFSDPHELRPMPDYHKERLFLRTGCIRVSDASVDADLRNRTLQDVSVDNRLRTATSEAYKEILTHSGKDFFELEVLLWSFARSLCYHAPMCADPVEDQGNFADHVQIGRVGTCPFSGVCAQKTEYWQPVVDTNFH